MSITNIDRERITRYIDELLEQDSAEEGALNERQKSAIRRISEAHDPQFRDSNNSQTSINDFSGGETNYISFPLIDGVPRQHQIYDRHYHLQLYRLFSTYQANVNREW